MWLFEENYRLLRKLIPALEEGEDRFVLMGDDDAQDLEVRILERAKYTTTLCLIKPFSVDNLLMPDLSMNVRIYRDAGVAEVLGYQGCARIPPRYRIRKYGEYLLDEKRQVNYLLNDLLRHCLRDGYRDLRESGITSV